jgi:hypothetical protein
VTKRNEDVPVYSISDAQPSLSDDQDARHRRYMYSMILRMVCFGGALLVEGPLRWILLLGSLVLPWVAVVIANAGRETVRKATPHTTHQAGRELNS